MSEEEAIMLQIIADIMNVDVKSISPDVTLNELGADELDMVEITMALEQALDKEFTDFKLLINPAKDKQFSVGEILKIASKYF